MVTGSRMLRVELHDHQYELGGVLDHGEETTAIQWPRREGKTTAVWCWLLGRCEDEPDTQVLVTAQSGVKARERFLGIARTLDRTYPEHDGGPRIKRGAGHEEVLWGNGSRLWVTAPKPESVRGDAADVIYVDEPQELQPDDSLDLQQGVLPLMDTRPGAQIVLSGTPGKTRAGWFWQALQAALGGAPGHAASIHAAAEGTDLTDESTWPTFHHGLVAGMTTVETLRKRLAALGLAAFAMEYGGQWPGSSDDRAIPDAWWEVTRAGFSPRPARFGLAFDTAPDGSVATLAAAWRDGDGLAYVEVVEYGDPRTVGRAAVQVARKYKVPVGGDTIGANADLHEGISRSSLPKSRLVPLKLADMYAATSGIMAELRVTKDHPEVTLRQPDQPSLNTAAEVAAWRDVGDGGRLFARRASAGDVTPLVAAASALLVYDRMPAPAPAKIITRRSTVGTRQRHAS